MIQFCSITGLLMEDAAFFRIENDAGGPIGQKGQQFEYQPAACGILGKIDVCTADIPQGDWCMENDAGNQSQKVSVVKPGLDDVRLKALHTYKKSA
jgi:hypothetical protein